MLSCIGQIKLMRQLTRVQQDGRVEFDFEENTELAENVFGPETSGPPGDEYTERDCRSSLDLLIIILST
jgi:hypothetical protein